MVGTRRFLAGAIFGALVVWWYFNYYDTTRGEGEQWFQEKAANYRGDQKRKAADEILR